MLAPMRRHGRAETHLEGASSPGDLRKASAAPGGSEAKQKRREVHVEFFKIKRALQITSLSVAMITVGIGASGCQLIKMFAKSQKHAAIAFDENTGGWGYSFDQLTEDLAKKAATSKCSTCTVRLSWNQGCGALAQSATKKNVMTAATGSNRPAAEGAARADCLSKGGGTCNVVVWACNSK